MEGVVLEPSTEFRLMSLTVMNGHILKLYQVRDNVNGHVGARVVTIHIIDKETQRVGNNITLQVDGVEITEQDGLTRHLALDITGKRLHIGLEELDVGVVGVKLNIERIVGDVDATVEETVTAIGLSDITLNQHTARLIIKRCLDVNVTHH